MTIATNNCEEEKSIEIITKYCHKLLKQCVELYVSM